MTRRSVGKSSPREPVDPDALARTLVGLGLEETQTNVGPIWTRLVLDKVPRPDSLPSFLGLFSQAAMANPSPGELLFLDTETTGLAGGTGTLAFLVGLSWWTDQGLATRQFFLASPSQEPALLYSLEELAASFSVVVSFNGASFDLPLLRTRALMNRSSDPLHSLISWDLLVPSRRLWGRMMENCRQQTLEQGVCCLPPRTGDIEGARIPSVWFEFLEDGEAGQLGSVLHHNHLDMLGMAHLFTQVVSKSFLIDDCERGLADGLDWPVAWALGRICESLGEKAGAIRWMQIAEAGARRDSSLGCDPRFLADAIRVVKRSGKWNEVEKIISRGLIAHPRLGFLQREAAIFYERRIIDLQKALVHASLCGENKRVERISKKLKIPRQGN